MKLNNKAALSPLKLDISMKNLKLSIVLATILLVGRGSAAILGSDSGEIMNPRTAQTQEERFLRAISIAVSVSNQPKSNKDRRVAMISAIRRKVAFTKSNFNMVELEQILISMGHIPRERFLPTKARDFAYIQTPFPIGYDQTISDSYIVAVMTAAVQPHIGGTVLDVGTGSGYQAAVLSQLTSNVVSIEIVPALAVQAADRLRKLGYRNVSVIEGDGFAGVPTHAPFDAIIVAAGATMIPPPLIDQLKPGGRLVMPIGPTQFEEQLILVSKAENGALAQCSLGPAAFVPFTGKAMNSETTVRQSGQNIPFCYDTAVT